MTDTGSVLPVEYENQQIPVVKTVCNNLLNVQRGMCSVAERYATKYSRCGMLFPDEILQSALWLLWLLLPKPPSSFSAQSGNADLAEQRMTAAKV